MHKMNNALVLSKIFAAVTGLVLLTQCGPPYKLATDSHEVLSDFMSDLKGPLPTILSEAQGTITYRQHILPLIEANCKSCHGKNSPQGNLLIYDEAFFRRDEIKTRVAVMRNMPPGKPLPPDQQQTFAAWVDAGAPESSD